MQWSDCNEVSKGDFSAFSTMDGRRLSQMTRTTWNSPTTRCTRASGELATSKECFVLEESFLFSVFKVVPYFVFMVIFNSFVSTKNTDSGNTTKTAETEETVDRDCAETVKTVQTEDLKKTYQCRTQWHLKMFMKQPGTISAPFHRSVKDINNIWLTHLFSLFENDICTSYYSIECQCVIYSVCHHLMYQGFLVNIWTPHIH